MQKVGDFLIIKDALQPAEVIHVIAGPDYRAEYAITLYKQGYAKYIFFTGDWCELHQVNHAQHGKEMALLRGVPEQSIITNEEEITSTYQEAEKLMSWLSQKPQIHQSVIVVSDPFHMRRAQWTYRLLMGNQASIQMAPIPFESLHFQHQWWTDAKSQRYVRDEYLKFVYYWLRYQVRWKPIQAWLVSLDRE